MQRRITAALAALVTAVAVAPATADPAPAAETIVVDGQSTGRTFDGVGALSAGASSRLLYDYPPQQRDEILDYLFKPGYGAALQILKVEIAGDVNSTSGSELAHQRTPDEVDCDRGYEWWLMAEAKERNPDITLAALAWGSPAWTAAADGTPDGGFYSPQTIDFYLSWMDCATQHGLTIDYLGGWNERGYDTAWYVDLEQQLADRYPETKIVAADDCCADNLWRVADSMAADPAFREAVDVVGVHFACGHRAEYKECTSTQTAKDLGNPLWMSENAAGSRHIGAAPIARALNRMYTDADMTSYISWSLISAWYANLPIADSGLMVAEWPWSGYYDVGTSIWANAHTTQFTKPGWHYLETGSGRLAAGGSYVSLVSPDGADYSTIIEGMDLTEPTPITLRLANLPESELQIWSSDLVSGDPAEQFQHVGSVTPENGTIELTAEPGHVYSISTRTDAGKGTATPPGSAHDEQVLPFTANFENLPAGEELARYFSDVNGAFEAVPCGGGREGTCYRQQVAQQPVTWNASGFLAPLTVAGDPRWWGDYALRAKVMVEGPGYVELIGRLASHVGAAPPVIGGYHLQVGTSGWQLFTVDSTTRQSRTLASGAQSIPAGTWHDLELRMTGDQLVVLLDGTQLASVRDGAQRQGNIGLRTSAWQHGQFDDVSVTPTGPAPAVAPLTGVTASSDHGFYRGNSLRSANAIDGRPETMWHSEFTPAASPPHTLTVDLGKQSTVEGLLMRPRLDGDASGSVTRYRIEVSTDGQTYTPVTEGTWPVSAATKTARWAGTPARYVRLVALEGNRGFASVAELDVVTKWAGRKTW
jgi:O-glycosyl hydrolase